MTLLSSPLYSYAIESLINTNPSLDKRFFSASVSFKIFVPIVSMFSGIEILLSLVHFSKALSPMVVIEEGILIVSRDSQL